MSLAERVMQLHTQTTMSCNKLTQYYIWLTAQGKLTGETSENVAVAAGIIRRLFEDFNNSLKRNEWENAEYIGKIILEWNDELAEWLARRLSGHDDPPPYMHWDLNRMPVRFTAYEPEEY